MQIKSILAGAAIALAAAVGSASAADQFTTLEGIQVQAMTPQEMGVVKGMVTGQLALILPDAGGAGTTPMGVITGVTGGLAVAGSPGADVDIAV